MTKTLQRHGNSMALLVDKTTMDLLGISADTPLQITVRSGSLIVTPVHVGMPREEVEVTLARLRPRYKRMLENLAK